MALSWEQAAAVHAREPSVAVVAGAGTGKTRVLVERYLHLVQDLKVPIPRILAVTFTEKAAREMKDRVRRALPEAEARKAEFAPISTIHAFLARTLRERALDAGVDPRFAIADEITADFLLEEALRETVDSASGALRAALVDLEGGEDALKDLYLAARATPHAMEDLRPVEPDLGGLRARLERFLEDSSRETARGRTGEKLRGLRGIRGRLLELDPAAARELTDLVKGNVAVAQRDLFRRGRDLAKEYARLDELERARSVGAAVVEALARLDETFSGKKRADGLLDFADLERVGLRLLRTGIVAGDYDHLLVDEYQDTSRIQEACLDELAKGCRRFGVGDAKQSIYRFRYADPDVFREFQGHARCYRLAESYRSRPELVQFTNGLFRALLPEIAQDLVAKSAWRDKGAPSVEVIRPEAANAAEGRRREARALARRLRDVVEGGAIRITRADGEDEPIGYRHCGMLLRATTNLAVYERALVDEGVPYVVVQGRGYYAAREVVDLAHLLLLLADPLDGYRAVAAMTSLLCGVPDGDLVHLPGAGPLPLRALAADRPAAIPVERWERLRTFARRFSRWRDLMGRAETGDLVETILSETRFADLLLLEADGRRRHANLLKALRRARKGREDAVTYARALLEFRERELRESEAPIASETDDVVKVMTIHAAKGLEFPLVAVPDLAFRGPRGPDRILRADGVFAFKLRGEPKPRKPPGYAILGDRERAEAEAERMRLLYVAFTRAGEHLILSGASHGESSVLDRLGDAFVPEDALLEPERRSRRGAAVRAAVRRSADLPRGVERDDALAGEVLRRIDSLRPPPLDATPYVAAVADLVEFRRCPRRYRLKRFFGIEIDDPEETREPVDSEELPRRELGTAFHELMQEVGPGARPDDATIGSHLPAPTPANVAKMRGWCAWLAEQPIAEAVRDRKQHREMPFLARVHGMPVRGVIDLYAPSVPLLLDYKTSGEVRPQEYGVQVAVYLAALRDLSFATPASAHLVYVDAEEVVEVEAAPLAGLVEEFRAAHRGEGRFPPVPGPACVHCDFRGACLRDGVACP